MRHESEASEFDHMPTNGSSNAVEASEGSSTSLAVFAERVRRPADLSSLPTSSPEIDRSDSSPRVRDARSVTFEQALPVHAAMAVAGVSSYSRRQRQSPSAERFPTGGAGRRRGGHAPRTRDEVRLKPDTTYRPEWSEDAPLQRLKTRVQRPESRPKTVDRRPRTEGCEPRTEDRGLEDRDQTVSVPAMNCDVFVNPILS